MELDLFFQLGHADLEELVEIAAGNGQEPDALEQGYRLVLGLREHAPIELEERKLAVDVEPGGPES